MLRKIYLKKLVGVLCFIFTMSGLQAQTFNSRAGGAWNTVGTFITAVDQPFTVGTAGVSTAVSCSSDPTAFVSVGDVLVTSGDAMFGANSTVTAVNSTTITITTAANIAAGTNCRVRRVPTNASDVTIAHAVTAPVAAVNINNLTINTSGSLVLAATTFTVAGTLTVSAATSVTIAATTFSVTGVTNNSGTITDNNNGGVTTFGGLFTNSSGATFTGTAVTAAAGMVFNGGIANAAGATSFAGGAATLASGTAVSAVAAASFNNIVTASGALAISGAGGLTLSGGNSSVAGNLTINPGGTLTVSTAGTFGVTGTTQNDGTFIDNNNGAATTFTGLVTNTGTFTTSTVVTPANLVFSGGFTHTSGTQTSAAATFATGKTITATSAIAFSGAVATSGATILTMTGAGGITVSGGYTSAGGGSLTINSGTAVVFGTAAASSISGNLIISNTGSLTVSTPGAFTVTGTTQNDGTFIDNNNAAITTFTGLVTNTGTFTTSTVTTAANLVFSGGFTHTSGTLTSAAATFATGQTITATSAVAFTGAVATTGATTLTMTGAGGITISGGYTSAGGGSLTINSGTAVVFGTAAASSITGNLIISSTATLTVSTPGAFTVTGTTQNDGTFIDNDNTAITTFTGLVTNTGTFTTSAVTTAANLLFNGGFTHTSGTQTSAAATFATGRTITATSAIAFSGAVATSGAAILTMAGAGGITVSGGYTSAGGGSLTINSGTAVSFSGAAASSISGNLIISATAALTVSTTSTFGVTGTTQNAGTFVDSDNTAATTFTGLVTNTGTFTTTSVTTTARMVFNGGLTQTSGTLTIPTATFATGQAITATTAINFTAGIATTGALTLTVDGAGGVTLSGAVASSVSGNLSITAISSLTVGTTSTFAVTGTTQNAGTFVDSDNTAATTFTGLVTNTGTFTTSSVTTTNRMNFNGGLTQTSGTITVPTATFATGATITATTAINFTSNIVASGTLAVAGAGGVTLSSSLANTVAGTLTVNAGAALTLNGSGGLAVTGASTINGSLTLTNGIYNNAAANVTFGAAATVNGAFTTSNFILTTGNVIKLFDATGSFTFPVGTGLLYTPATINITAATFGGALGSRSVSVKPFAAVAPSQLDATYSLTKYWNIGTVNLSAINAILVFTYDNTEANAGAGVEASYVGGQYTSTPAWVADGTVDPVLNTISFTRTSASDLNTNWTAGPANAFISGTTFYSRANGNWESASTWSTTALGGTAAATPPTNGSIVIIGNSNTVTVSASIAKSMATVQIDATGILDMGTQTGLTITTLNGTGLIRLASATFPTVTTNNFLGTAGSTVEYNTAGVYNLPAAITSYQNLTISGNSVKTLQAAAVVNGNLIIGSTATLQVAGQSINVKGTSAIAGTFNDNTLAGVNLFEGNVNISASGTWTTSNNPPFTFRGGISNSGAMTITGTGVYTFNTYSQTIGGSGAISFLGNVLVSGAITVTNQNTNTVTITGTLDGDNAASTWLNDNGSTLSYNNVTLPFNTLGVLNASTNANTVNYSLGAGQPVKAVTYYHLTVSNSNTKTLQGNTAVLGNLNVAAGTLEVAANNITVSGSTTLTGILNDNNVTGTNSLQSVVMTGGTITSNPTSAFSIGGNLDLTGGSGTLGQGDITVTGTTVISAARTLTLSSVTGAKVFTGDITVNGTWSASTALTNITINGNLTVNAGATFTSNTGVYSFGGTGSIIGGTVAALTITNITATGTITNQAIGLTTSTLTVTSPGTFTNTTVLNAAVDILGTGSFTQAANSTLNITSTNGVSVTTFSASASGNTVNYNANAAQPVKAVNYYNLTSSVGATKTLQGNVAIGGNLVISAGTLDLGTTSTAITVTGTAVITGALVFNATTTKTVTINGNLSGAGSINMSGGNLLHVLNLAGATNAITTLTTAAGFASSVNYTLAGDQTIFASANYMNLGVSGSGIKSIQAATTAASGVSVAGTATLSLNSTTLTSISNITISTGATLNVNANATLQMGAASSINNSGIFKAVGTAGNIATVTRTGAGSYTINQAAASGEFHAKYYAFNFLGTNGITISNGTIDAVENFSNGSFASGTGTQSINLTGLNFSDFTVSTTVFGAGPTYNVSRTSGSGIISFQDATGALSGENFDNDNGNPGTLVEWINPSTTFYSQATGSFGTLSNWNTTAGGGGSTPVASDLTNGLSTFIIQNGHTITLNQNVDVLALTVGAGSSGTLTIGNDASARTLLSRVNLNVRTGATINLGSDATHLFDIRGNFTNSGTVNLRSSVIRVADLTFNGASTQVFGPNTINFNNVTFAAASSVTANAAMNIQGYVTLAAGAAFQDGGFTHNVGGDWIDGTTGAMTGTGTINFNSSTAQTLQSASNFNNITFNGGGTVTLTGAATVAGNFYVTNNTNILASGNVTHTVAKNFTVDAGSTYTQSQGTIDFNGAAVAQTIDVNNSIFINVNFTNGGAPFPKNVVGGIVSTGTVYILSSAVVNSIGSHALKSIRQEGTCNFSGQITFSGGGTINNNATAALSLGTADIIIASGNEAIQAGNLVSVGGNVTINTGGGIILNLGSTLTGVATKTLTAASGSNIYIRGTSNFPSSFSTYTLATTSNSRYDQNFAQTVRGGITYGNLLLDYNTKTVDGPMDINGTLTLGSTSLVTADLRGYSHTIEGNLTNTGAASTFINDATVTFDAPDADQTIGNGTYTFNNIAFSSTAPTVNQRTKFLNAANMTINGNFSAINAGGAALISVIELSANTVTGSSGTFSLGPNVRLNTSGASTFQTTIASFAANSLDASSTIRFYATAPVDQNIPATGIIYGNIEIVNNGNKIALGSLDINGNFSRTTNGTPIFVDGGFSHTIAGDMNMADVYYPAPSSTSTITFDGAAQGIGFANNNINFYNVVFAGTGIKTFANTTNGATAFVLGNLTINDGVTVDFNTKNIQISGNWLTAGTGTGVFTQTGTTTFLGTTANQTVTMASGAYFGNLTINKSNASFQTLTANSDLTIGGSLTLTTNNAIFNATGRNINIGINFTFGAGTSFTSTGSTFLFNGSVAQSLAINQSPAVFNNLSFSGTGTKTLSNNPIQVNGNLTIIGSTTFNGNNQQITVLGNWTNGGTFQHNSTVNFTGGNQTISSSAFGSVSFAGTNTKTLSGNISLTGSLAIQAASTLDVTSSNYAISVSGNWTNAGTFLCQSGTVTFNSGAKTITTGGIGAGFKFYNVLLTMTTATNFSLAGNIEIGNDLTITSGSFVSNAFNVLVGGNFINSDVFNQNGVSTLTFTAASGTKTFNPGSGANTFRAITVNGAASAVIQLTTNDLIITNNQALTITSGAFKLNARSLTMTNGNITIALGGTLDVDAGAHLYLASGASVTNSGGIIKVVGTSGSFANIARNGGIAGQGYTITQTAGTFHAKYYQIQNTVGAGITISGGTIDATNNFSNGTFTGGAGSQYLILSGLTFADFTASSVVFNSGPTNNVTRLSGTGNITFDAATGSLSGALFENDAVANYIRWTSLGKRWTNGGGDNDWNNASNWSPAGIPTVSDTIYIDHTTIALATPFSVNISNANANAYRLIIDKQGGAGAITLTLSGGKSLTVAETFNLLVGNTLTVTNSTNIINVGGSWANSGTFNTGSSTVNLTGTSGSYTITPGAAGFYNLNINGGATYTLAAALTIAGNLNISNGTLDVANTNNISISGNWTNSGAGVFTPGIATVTFNNAGAQTISGGPFYNFVTGGSGTKTIASASLTVGNDITIAAGTVLDGGTNIILLTRHWTNNASSAAFTQSGAGTVIFNGGAQTIDNGTQSTTFNTVTLAGSVNNTKLLGRSITVNGDLTVSSSAQITFDLQTNTVTGTAGKTFSISGNGILIARGANNFPSGFGTVSLVSISTVQYRADIDQTIYATTYGNLTLVTNTNVMHAANAAGNLIVAGALTVNDVFVQLNMNNRDMALTGNLSFPAGGRQMLWGTGVFTHNGAGWNIDVDITGNTPDFGAMVLSGTGTKAMLANLNFGGDVTVQSGVTLTMSTFQMIATTAGKTFTLSNGAILNNNVIATTSVAFPTGFTTYSVNSGSTVTLNGAADQTIASGITYGILNLSNNAVNNTLLGTLNVAGNFSTRASTLVDGNFNINLGGATNDIRNYTPSAGTLITLNGAAQSIYDGVNNANLDFAAITFAGTGTKIIGAAPGIGNVINISGNVIINSAITVTDSRNTNFAGAAWTNNGTFTHSGGIFTYNGTSSQNINAGAINTYNVVAFTNTGGTITFAINGTTVTGTFTINPGVAVDLGALTHVINGSVTNSGTWTTSSTSFTFSGGFQTITSPVFNARNIILAGSNTKTMGCDWSIRDLTINLGVTLTTTAINHYNLTLTGSWTNNGVFANNGNTVAFESSSTATKTITSGGSAFNVVTFNQSQTSARTYTLLSATTTISNTLTIGNGALIDVTGVNLNLGSSNGISETHTVQAGGTLRLNSNANLKFDNQDGNSSLNVAGTFIAVGTVGNVANILRLAGGNRTNISVTGSVSAQYYYFEYLSDNGFNVQSTATVDAINNFSNGTWSNMNTALGAAKYYLVMNAPNPTSISNITFNFGGAPTVGTHFNVQRAGAATGTLTFIDPVSGILGTYLYESDPSDVASPAAGSGQLRWPVTVTVTWTGATNRDWNVNTNWTPNTVPTSVIDATIPDVANDPIITSASAVCRNLILTNGILGLDNGFSLTVNKDVTIGVAAGTANFSVFNPICVITVAGAWTRGANANFTHGNGKVIFTGAAGAYTITPLTSAFYNVDFNGSSSNFYINGATINIAGTMSIVSGTVYPNTANYVLNLGGDFNNLGIYSTAINGTVNLNGTTQTLTNAVVNNLIVAGSGTKTTLGSDTIYGTTVISSGATLKAGSSSTIDFRNNVTISAGGSFDDGGNSHTFSGPTWTGTGTYVTGTGLVTFNRLNAQAINGGTFNNLTIAGSNNKTLGGNVAVNGDFELMTGTNYLNLVTFNLTSNTATGTFTLDPGTILYVRGANNAPSNFAAYNMDLTSITNYDAAFDQTVGGITYGILNLQNATVKTLAGSTTVLGALNFNAATLDVSPSNYSLNVAGTFNNGSTGSFIARGGAVILDGTLSTTIQNGVSGTKTFYDLTVNKSSGGTITLIRDITVLNNLKSQNGIYSNNGFITTIGGSLTATSGTFANSGTYLMTMAGGAANIQTNGSTLNNLTINGAGTTFTLQDNLATNGNFTLTAGTFDGNGKTANLGIGARTVSISGTYKVGAGGTLALGAGTTVNVSATGIFELIGTLGNTATVTRTPAGSTYNFTVDGTIRASQYLMEYMSTSGIQINSGAVIDATYNFSDGTFTNGVIGGTFLRIENSQTMTISNVAFPTNPGGGTKNVTKITTATGILTFDNATGIFAGAAFENDPSNLIFWTGPITLTWNGSLSSDWFTPGNWTASSGPNIVPTGVEDVVITTAGSPASITLDGALAKKLTINASALLTVNTPYATAPDMTVNGDLVINGTIIMSGANDTLFVAGNWTKAASGNFTPGTGTIIFTSSTGTKIINNGAASFNHLVINGPSSFQLGAATVVNGNFNIVQGTLDVTGSNYALNVKGNWINAGTFTPRTGAVTLSSATAGTVVLNPGTSAFNDLIFSAGASTVYQLTTNNILVNGNTTITTGTLTLNGLTFNVGDGIGSDNLTIAGTLDISANGFLKMGANTSITVNSGGAIKIVGSNASNVATITRQSAGGTYSFTVNSGGTVYAQYYLIEYMNTTGLRIKAGATINTTNHLSDGTFSNGAAGGTYLTLENSFADFTTANVVFNSGAQYNATRLLGSGIINFLDATGSLAGFNYENDDLSATTGSITWSYTFPISTWTGLTSVDWNDATNWDIGIVPTLTYSVIIPDVSTGSTRNPVLNSGANGQAKDLTIYSNGAVTLGGSKSLTVDGSVVINAGATFTVSAGSVSNITVNNLWSNSGTFTNGGASTVTLGATSGTKSITTGGNSFNNLVLNGAATFQSQSSIVVNGNVTISAGTLQMTSSAHQLTVGGNWSNSGNFIHGSNTVVFNKTTGAQQISGSNNTFYNLTISTTGINTKTMTLGSNISVDGSLVISGTNCSFVAGANTINLKGDWTNGGKIFSGAGSTVNLTGSVPQNITRNPTEAFNNLTVNNTSPTSPQVYLLKPTAVSGVITLTKGTISSGSGSGNLSLNLNTGAIAGSGTGDITGKVTVSRDMTAGWHYVGIPLQNTTYAEFNDDITLATNNFYVYKESVANNITNIGWTRIMPASMSTTFAGQKYSGGPTNMTGYGLKFAAATTNVDVTGDYVHSTTFTTGPMSFTNSGNPAADGWHLLGNPFPSYFDWNSAGVTRVNINAGILFYNPSIGSNTGYVPASGMVPEAYINGGSPYIPAMQAFWIQTNNSGASVTVTKNARIVNPAIAPYGAPSFYRQASTDVKTIKLSAGGSGCKDETVLRFSPLATNDFDNDFDLSKFKNDTQCPSVYTTANGLQYAINSLSEIMPGTSVPLNFETSSFGFQTLSVINSDNFNGTMVILEDKLLNKKQNLSENPLYSFSSQKGDSAARFVITFEEGTITSTNEAAGALKVNINSNGNRLRVDFINNKSQLASVSVSNILGQEVYRQDNSAIVSGMLEAKMALKTGVYLVKVIADGKVFSGKIYVEN